MPDYTTRKARVIPPDLLRAAGLGSYVDGFQDEENENYIDPDPPTVSFRASGSDVASWVEDVDMGGVDLKDDSTEDNKGYGNDNATILLNDNNMYRYYGNMDGAMDDVENYTSKVEVAWTDPSTQITHDETKESEESSSKTFNLFGLSRELRDILRFKPNPA